MLTRVLNTGAMWQRGTMSLFTATVFELSVSLGLYIASGVIHLCALLGRLVTLGGCSSAVIGVHT